MCQIFCCCIIQGVTFNYHHRNVRSRVSVSNFQVSVSVSKFEPGLGLGGYGLDYITASFILNSCMKIHGVERAALLWSAPGST